MKANDLMIGDWVEINDIPKQIKFIDDCINHKIIAHGVNKDGKTIAYVGKLNEEIKPIPLTPEILEKNGFERDAFTNLSPDFFYEDDACSISINLNSTCDKCKSIWVKNRNLRITASIEESRHSLQKKPLLLHQLQHALRLCGIEKEIIL